METGWMLLAYKVPREPTAKRVALWRRLKGLGSVYLQSGVCLLPKTDAHLRQLKMIEHEIAGMQGECVILQAAALDPAQAEKVMARFRADRDDAYEEFIDKCDDFEAGIAKEVAASHYTYAELEENEADLTKLRDWLARIGKLDFYGGARAAEAAERLAGCETLLDDYARKVFDAHDENR